VTKLRVENLRGYYKNPRRGNLKVIQDSIESFGQYRSIVVNEGTLTGRPYEILVGNHTFQAAKAAGLTELDAKLIDVDEETAAKIVLADNRTSDSGGYHDEALLELLESLDSLEHTGYTDEDLDDLFVALEPPASLTTTDRPPTQEPDRFASSSMRAMYVEYTVDEFIAVQARLFALAKERGVTSNAAVVALLAREAREAL
jgi:hypothetical protein